MIESKEEQERIMIACHASPEGKSSGLARIQNFKPINIVRHDQSNTSGEGRVGQINTSGGRGEGLYQLSLVNQYFFFGGGGGGGEGGGCSGNTETSMDMLLIVVYIYMHATTMYI